MNKDILRESVKSRYGSTHDIEVYQKRSTEGLRIWEHTIVDRYMSGGRVLDVGCGGGREAFALESMGYSVDGIDIVLPQVESAAASAKERGSRAQFHHYDGRAVPFGDGLFAAGTFWSQILGNVPGKTSRISLLAECRRTLAPNGILSLSVHEREKTMKDLNDLGDSYRLLPDAEPGDLLLDTAGGIECYWHYFTKDEIITECETAGLKIVEIGTSAQFGQTWDNLLIVVCTHQ